MKFTSRKVKYHAGTLGTIDRYAKRTRSTDQYHQSYGARYDDIEGLQFVQARCPQTKLQYLTLNAHDLVLITSVCIFYVRLDGKIRRNSDSS